jgi:hypothetical protein
MYSGLAFQLTVASPILGDTGGQHSFIFKMTIAGKVRLCQNELGALTCETVGRAASVIRALDLPDWLV